MAEPTTLRFAAPPVRSVRLAYFFTSERPILTVHAAGVYQEWRTEYPFVRELAPRAPIDGETKEVMMLADPEQWPMPFIEFEAENRQTRVFFQADRFGLSWEFGDGTDVLYPGFDALSRELDHRFSQFREVTSTGAGALTVTGAECAYKNEIEGYAFAQYVTGLLTGWTTSSGMVIRDEDGASFTHHWHHGGDAAKPVWVSVESAESQAAELRITTRVQDLDVGGADALAASHDIAVAAFLSATSPEMRNSWGPA